MQRPKALRCAKICTVQDSAGNGDTEEIIIENIQKELQCPLCFEYLQTPIMTKCEHIFCQSCIDKQLRHDQINNRNSVCAVCRNPLETYKNSEKLCRHILLQKIVTEVNQDLPEMKGKTLLIHYFQKLLTKMKETYPENRDILEKCKRIFSTSFNGQDVFDRVILHAEDDKERIDLMCSNFLKFFDYVKQVHQPHERDDVRYSRFDYAVDRSNSHMLLFLKQKLTFNDQDFFFVNDLIDNTTNIPMSEDSFDRPFKLRKNDIVCMHFHKAFIGKVLSSEIRKSEDGKDVEMYRVHFPSVITNSIHLCQRSNLTFCFPGLQIQLDSTEISL